MSAPPPISVIIICQNAGSRLPPVLESIRSQRGPEIEIIALDLGSTDGTQAVLEAERAHLSQLVIAASGNRYAGLNEAIGRATGDWLLLLGGRDRLVGDVVLSETLNWMKKTEAGVVAGESASDDGRIHKLHARVNAVAHDFTPPSATFYRRSLFAENGGFDAGLVAMGEYDFNVRLWKARVRFKPIPLRIAACDAARSRYDWHACREEIGVRHRYFGAGRSVWWDAMSVRRWAVAALFERQGKRFPHATPG